MIKIPITQEQINKSEPMLEEKNPLGWALREFFPNSKIHVGIHYAHIDNRSLKLSPELSGYLEKFDIEGKEAIKPIEVELDLTIEG